jgi:hypothetical protein
MSQQKIVDGFNGHVVRELPADATEEQIDAAYRAEWERYDTAHSKPGVLKIVPAEYSWQFNYRTNEYEWRK